MFVFLAQRTQITVTDARKFEANYDMSIMSHFPPLFASQALC